MRLLSLILFFNFIFYSSFSVSNENNIKLSLACIVCGGSILIEDFPGTGKTTFAKTITYNLGLDFKRIQFTSDLLPADILGYNFFKGDQNIFQKGPIFTNVVLADELNRGSAKSQSAFLEAMEEKNVTIDGETYKLPDPFFAAHITLRDLDAPLVGIDSDYRCGSVLFP